MPGKPICMCMRHFILCFIMGLLVCTGGYAQREKVRMLRGVRGEYSVVLSTSDVTGRQATEYAREDAKRKAIEQVCGSRLSVWDKAEISSAGETFNSLSVNQVDGEIVGFEIVEEGNAPSPVRPSETVFYCVANVKVKRGVEPDPDFTAVVEGIRSVYLSGENLTFTVLPYRECYLKIFLFEDSQTGYRLYPNEFDRPELLHAGEKIAFPKGAAFDVNKNSAAETETNRLVFVFTKSERPFYHSTVSRQEIEEWMVLIPNDEKYIVFTVFDIKEK